ncbi:hypothetical protein [Bacillus cereus]|uniref:hypothetical protein n=1 Tax=Bacillus cereus TaxID=1396 RepID=UPI002A4C52A0|nr:hypothetical protein [Bacillus cereus]MCU5588462.1 hypothetical protein [Bacillus cereus]MDA2437016.1 hypothetical protein [Bacillus cereus]MDA2443950.1 hypothetical protein [Bacillus cereus]
MSWNNDCWSSKKNHCCDDWWKSKDKHHCDDDWWKSKNKHHCDDDWKFNRNKCRCNCFFICCHCKKKHW